MLLGAIRQIVAARYLGPEGYGIIGVAESFENVLIRAAPLGLTVSVPVLLAGAVAERKLGRAGRILGTSAVIAAVLIVVAGLAVAVLADSLATWMGAPEAGPVLRIWGIVVIGLGACQVASAALRGMLRIGPATLVRDVIPNASVLAGLLVAAALGVGLVGVGVGYAVGALAAMGIAITMVRRTAAHVAVRATVDRRAVRPLLAVTGPTLAMVVAGQLTRQLNVPILLSATDAATVGYFTTALFLATATEGAFTAVVLVYMPYASRLLAEGGLGHLAAIQSAIGRWTYLVSLVPIAVLSAFAEPIITIAFGSSFLPAALPLRIVLIGLLVRAVVGPRNSVQLALGRGADVALSFAVSLVVALLLALALTPSLGMVGAAISFAVSFAVRAVVSEIQLRRSLPGSGMEPRELIAAAGIVLFVLPLIVPSSWLGWVAPILAVAATLFVFQATRDQTDDELMAQISRRLRGGIAR
jgi:O-antigen/teichoic acid export membrane protein